MRLVAREARQVAPNHQNDTRPPPARSTRRQTKTRTRSGLQRPASTAIIPPPCASGGAAGASTPVSTAPLGLIHHYDPLLATQLREDPDSLAVRDTRMRVLATIHKVRTGLVGQLAALTQWEEATHSQGGQ